ncbi:MAG: hypothetical protein ABJ059_05915, partial [Hyphomicrobiales bacterium]
IVFKRQSINEFMKENHKSYNCASRTEQDIRARHRALDSTVTNNHAIFGFVNVEIQGTTYRSQHGSPVP